MTQEEIIEGNELIAEFMNIDVGHYTSYPEEGRTQFSKNDLEYHSSWDWLIPACKKWDTLEVEDENLVEYTKLCDQLDNTVSFYEIEPLFQQLVKCIEQYNKWKK